MFVRLSALTTLQGFRVCLASLFLTAGYNLVKTKVFLGFVPLRLRFQNLGFYQALATVALDKAQFCLGYCSKVPKWKHGDIVETTPHPCKVTCPSCASGGQNFQTVRSVARTVAAAWRLHGLFPGSEHDFVGRSLHPKP